MLHRILLTTALAAVALGGAFPAAADPEPAPNLAPYRDTGIGHSNPL